MSSRPGYQFPFEKYPALRIALLLITGILLHKSVPLSDPVPLFIFVTVAVPAVITEVRLMRKVTAWGIRLAGILSILLVISFGWMRADVGSQDLITVTERTLSTSDWEAVRIAGNVISTSKNSEGRLRADVTVSETEFESGVQSYESFRVRVLIDNEVLQGGEKLEFLGTIIPVSEKRNPHQFDYKKYLKERGISIQIRMDELISVQKNETVWSWSHWRSKARELTEKNFDEETAPIAKALLLGYKQDLEGSSRQDFARAGLSHILAVSGLHVGFVVAPLWLLIPFLLSLKYGRNIGFVILILLLWGYAGLTGFSSSVMRASVTAGFLTWGKLFNKSPDSINLTSAAAVVLLIADPEDLFSVGFQLSFLAVFIILLTLPVIQHALPYWMRLRWYAKPLMVMIVSVVVQVGLYPVQVYYFGEVSLISPVANALFVPLLGVIVPMSLLSLMVTAFFPAAGALLAYPAEEFFSLLNSFVGYSGSLDWAWAEVNLQSLLLFPFWLSLLLLVSSLRIPEWRWKWMVICGVLLGIIQIETIVQKSRPSELRVVVFDVGQGDGILIRTPNKRNVLIDAGVWTPGNNSGRSVILPHLRAEKITKLDAVILSHPHADHIGGINELLDEIEIGVIYNSGFEYESRLYHEYRSRAATKGIQVEPVIKGQLLNIDPAVLFMVLAPEPGLFGDDPNQHSVVINLVYGESEFLFTGDAGEEQEERLVRNYGPFLDADFLKVGHHGSRTSSGNEFLELVTPEISVVSLAESNRFGHPHAEAISRLINAGGELLYTGRDRALIFTSDGRSIVREYWY